MTAAGPASSTVMLPELGPAALDDLAAALAGDRLRPPYSAAGVRRVVAGALADAVLHELQALHAEGFTAKQVARMLRTLAAERRCRQQLADRLELVWSGPDVAGITGPRDTAVVVRDLCRAARRSVLLANFSFDKSWHEDQVHKSRALWQPLADNMTANPDLKVRFFINIARYDHSKYTHEPAPFWIRSFVRHFREHLWPAERLPEMYYDPRALRLEPRERAILHAKCVVIDDARAFISSANFSQAGHDRNIEAGVVAEDPALARQLTAQFDALVQAGAVERIVIE